MVPRDLCEPEELTDPLMRWTVPPFGCYCFPYFTLRMLARDLEISISNHTDTNNPFRWHRLQFNLPCTTVYDASLTCVWLVNFYIELVVRVIVFLMMGVSTDLYMSVYDLV